MQITEAYKLEGQSNQPNIKGNPLEKSKVCVIYEQNLYSLRIKLNYH